MKKIVCTVFMVVVGLNASWRAGADTAADIPTTMTNISYGPHERNVLDFWQASGDGPRPLLVYIHGGGWTAGDKKQDFEKFRPFLEKGISYAAINYRLTDQAPLPAPVHDAARAIQFLRTKANAWNIDATHIALTGGSAGACTAMWILFHDDLADPQSSDPVLRESTRVCAASVYDGQTSLDPRVIESWVGPNVLKHRMIYLSVGEKSLSEALGNYEQHRATYHEFSPYNHLDKDDPPLFMIYDRPTTVPSVDASHGIHHPMLGLKLKEKADSLDHECHLLITGPLGSDVHASAINFLLRKLVAQ